MRNLILAALLLPITATASVSIVIPTGDGAVRLTDDPCPTAEKQARAYHVTTAGKVSMACWGYDPDEDMVFVLYESGDVFMYTITDAMMTDYGRAKIGKASSDINM